MTLAGRIKRLEAERWRIGTGGLVALNHDAKGEPIGARILRSDGVSFALSRGLGETVETFRLRAGMLAGDLACAQGYVLTSLRRQWGADDSERKGPDRKTF